MTIQNWEAFRGSIWDWGCLRGVFPRGIEPTDIDGEVEWCGCFLVLEAKNPGVPLKEGQRRSFEAKMARNKEIPGLFTIIVFRLWQDQHIGWRFISSYINRSSPRCGWM